MLIGRLDREPRSAGDRAELAVWSFLEATAPHSWIIVCDIPEKRQGRTSVKQSDCIVIAEQYLYHLEIKSFTGNLRVYADQPWTEDGRLISHGANLNDGFWKNHQKQCYNLKKILARFGIVSSQVIPKVIIPSDTQTEFGSSGLERDVVSKEVFLKKAIDCDRNKEKQAITRESTIAIVNWLKDGSWDEQIPPRNLLNYRENDSSSEEGLSRTALRPENVKRTSSKPEHGEQLEQLEQRTLEEGLRKQRELEETAERTRQEAQARAEIERHQREAEARAQAERDQREEQRKRREQEKQGSHPQEAKSHEREGENSERIGSLDKEGLLQRGERLRRKIAERERLLDKLNRERLDEHERELLTRQTYLTEKSGAQSLCRVVGVGGAGCNMVEGLVKRRAQDVGLIAANTDAGALTACAAPHKIVLGTGITSGLGARADPNAGRVAAKESVSEIAQALDGAELCVVVAGLGGGTGSGAAPVVARAARDKGVRTVAFVTMPFSFEGNRRMRIAQDGLEELKSCTSAIEIVLNQRLFEQADKDTTFRQAFDMVDDMLWRWIESLHR